MMCTTAAVRGLVIVLAGLCAAAQAGTIYVSTSGSDSATGQTWATAKKTVQAGLNAAVAGDQVWVVAGTYVQCITLKNGVALYGGFVGSETALSQRNWQTNLTILDGNQTGSVVTAPANITSSTRIDGFTIRNGKASYGGGIYYYSSWPTITNNTITGNTATSYGGGIYGDSFPAMISNNTITGNTASYGGGIYCGSPTITSNTITGNTASTYGGGIYCYYSSTMTITYNTIAGNTAGRGGGIYCDSSASSQAIAYNTITGNTASSDGGGIYCYACSPAITNNSITGNMASNGGGGIACIFLSSSSSPGIATNTIAGNTAVAGGGIWCYSASPVITNDTIAGNTASYGGGIYFDSSSPAIANTIIAFNSSGVYRNSSGTPTLRYCCVYGNGTYNYSGVTDPTGTNGNISVDPQLANVARSNLHVQPTSPCINAGDDAAVLSVSADMDGQPRVQGTHVDIGVDESNGTLWPTAAAIVYVSPGGNDGNSGLSWASAKRTVQAGIDAGGTGSQVWVAAGTYTGTIRLGFGMALYGGFAGSETNLSQRNWQTNVTILDGNQAGSVITAPPAATAATKIDGFTIRNGSGSSPGSSKYGGGIYCQGSSPTITNNTITGNTAFYGSGICCTGSSPTITNNTITSNTASYYGGGICCWSSSPTITNNTISGNTASSYGGGIYCSGSSPMITNNSITGNGASSNGGAIYCTTSSSPTIASNTISGNTASTYGGGIYCTTSSSPTITSNGITGNTASHGGGIYCGTSSPMIASNTIAGNTGSADGGGIYCYSASPVITNDTIAGNTASLGGGIYSVSSSPAITNTIIAFNSAGLYRDSSGTPTLRYCCVYGNGTYNYSGLTDPTGTNGNISVDPQLADVARGNLHVQATSPCVNAGDDAAVLSVSVDMDGQSRVQGAHVDIGADESNGTLWPAAPAILYVRPGGNDSNNGLSWASAKQTVQAAVDAGGTGSQVWVAAGTYTGTIRLGFGMALYGGFAGSETNLSQRNWQTNVTILDGNQAGSVITAPPAATTSTKIDGFTIRNGSGLSLGSSKYGGGIYCQGSSPTITNNTITGNMASHGGGICLDGSSPTITSNTITGNTANIYGGGVYCSWSSCPTISNNAIRGNISSRGGGGINCSYSSPTIASNTITSNMASSSGGGIDCSYSSPTIASNTITGNMALSGGGICCFYSSPTISRTIVVFNSSGVYRDSLSSDTPTLRYCCVCGNSAYNYSGLSDPTGTDGNISANPLFILTPSAGPDGKWATADDVPGDLHLAAGSPCINAGDPAYVPAAGEADMDGQPRKIGAAVDIGADEFCLTGDATYDGYVNVGDLQLLVAAWGARTGDARYNAAVDFNSDGVVNIADLQALVVNWGASL